VGAIRRIATMKTRPITNATSGAIRSERSSMVAAL
jgi:hypothetical protein